MQKMKVVIGGVIIVILIVGSGFYWFEWRPAKARQQCAIAAKGKNPTQLFQKIGMDYDSVYNQCLREMGIEN